MWILSSIYSCTWSAIRSNMLVFFLDSSSKNLNIKHYTRTFISKYVLYDEMIHFRRSWKYFKLALITWAVKYKWIKQCNEEMQWRIFEECHVFLWQIFELNIIFKYITVGHKQPLTLMTCMKCKHFLSCSFIHKWCYYFFQFFTFINWNIWSSLIQIPV